MDKLRKMLSFVAIAILACMCQKNQGSQPMPEPNSELNLSFSEKSISHRGEEFDIIVQANCDWTVQKDADWISIQPNSTQYSLTATLSIRVEENRSLLVRNATLIFQFGQDSKILTITQEALSVYLDCSLDNISFGYRTAEKTFSVTSNCGWEAKSLVSWLAIRPSTGLIGSFEMTVNVETNNSLETRDAQIKIWNQEYQIERIVYVKQGGKPNTEDKDYIDEYGINYGKGETIRGLTWAPVNCGFQEDSYPLGKMFQWGRKQGQGYNDNIYQDVTIPNITDTWAGNNGEEDHNSFYRYGEDCRYNYDWIIEGSDSYWNLGTEENPVKNTAYDPCPEGWRVPTAFEFKSLIEYVDRSWITVSEWNGYLFSENNVEKEPSTFFLPAGGRLNIIDGQALDRNIEAYYWTITANEGNSAYLYFNNENCSVNEKGSRAGGCLIRCIKE